MKCIKCKKCGAIRTVRPLSYYHVAPQFLICGVCGARMSFTEVGEQLWGEDYLSSEEPFAQTLHRLGKRDLTQLI